MMRQLRPVFEDVVFDSLAQEILLASVYCVATASQTLAQSSSEVDSQLFVLKHACLLRDEVCADLAL